MDATADVVDLTAIVPGYRSIAQLYADSRSAVDRGVRDREQQPATKILKPTSLWRRISGWRCCQNRIKLHQQPLIASVEIVLKRTGILNELERSPVIYKYMKPPNIGINLDCYRSY